MATTSNDWTPLDAYDIERSIRPRGGGGGHLISGSFYIIFGLGLLILSFLRARCYTLNTSFPEQDMITLHRISVAVCLAGVLGVLIHGLYGGVINDESHNFFHYLGHLAVFFSFFTIGLVGWYESKKFVPADASRLCYSLSFFFTYIIFKDHAKFQPGSMRDAHEVLANINLATSILLGYSVWNPRNVEMGVSVYVLILLQGVWVWTMSYLFFEFGNPPKLYRNVEDWPPRDHIVPLFVCQACSLVIICATTAVFFGNDGFWSTTYYNPCSKLHSVYTEVEKVALEEEEEDNTEEGKQFSLT